MVEAGPGVRKGWPPGVPGILLAILLSLVVLFGNALGTTAGGMILQVLVFVGMWMLAGVPFLAFFASNPRREALFAGLVLAILMTTVVGLIGNAMPRYAEGLVFVGFVIVALDMGCAAVTGILASRLRARREHQSPPPRDHVSAIVGIVAGCALLLFSGNLFPLEFSLHWPSAAFSLLPIGLATLFVGCGTYALMHRGPGQITSSSPPT